ncbi:branched-chain amino acid transport system II carrier protein [Caproiciproducens sp. MSJ-32]|uniref:branched-chain amino acid transport system II carrier protein n=1 Tax=Caproiciproducens sp. MSJ-32 TaxID=2841527 RepID=UPI001C102573|nr:branched-chain amino acid transport system II carrier protein [Caproiciproducens sp. MSJ-32]MBU5454772.1 branched-chain amino acid transport system II carrier protein [Caproiciproducens sp. MSJ-32]
MKKNTKDTIVIGFALFSMFFGAGNLIFPAFLGNKVGSQFLAAIIGFIITGVGLPFLAITACSMGDGTFDSISNRIGKRFSTILTILLFMAIGPMLAIPRTAATTFELAITPFFPNIPPIVAMIIYFLINIFFVFKSSSVIDTLGKYLTPTLIILLGFIIIKGLLIPIDKIVSTNAVNVFSSSLLEGYQTMDAIAALLFAGIITKSLKSKGYRNKEMSSMLFKSSAVAGIGLAFVYGGLTYIGAQTVNLTSESLGKTEILILISKSILGNLGPILIGTAMGLACLTTSIGLLSSGAEFFEKVSKGKLNYKLNVIIISIVSLVIATLGVDKIIVLSVPILNVLYPVAVTLIVTSFLNNLINNINAIRLGTYTSLIFGILSIIPGINLTFIPLAKLGFPWVLPTVIAIVIGCMLFPNTYKKFSEV